MWAKPLTNYTLYIILLVFAFWTHSCEWRCTRKPSTITNVRRVKTPNSQCHCSGIWKLQRTHKQQLCEMNWAGLPPVFLVFIDGRCEAIIRRPAGMQQRSGAGNWEIKNYGFLCSKWLTKKSTRAQCRELRPTRRPVETQTYTFS